MCELSKNFYHRSLLDFDNHLLQIIDLCQALRVRAYTRMAPRSFWGVGATFTKAVVDASLSGGWAGMKTPYAHACGVVTPSRKLWLWDVDKITEQAFGFKRWLVDEGLLLAEVPSKKGLHYISLAFDLRKWDKWQEPAALQVVGVPEMSLHKDNATNLFIPDDAA